MKLAKIVHARALEWEGYTLVWVPDYWTQETLQEAVGTAERDYLAFLKAFTEDEGPTVATSHSQPPYADYPDRTVADVMEMWEDEKRVYAAWMKERNKSRLGFPAFLQEQGMEPVDDHDPELVAEVDWADLQGIRLTYEAPPNVKRVKAKKA